MDIEKPGKFQAINYMLIFIPISLLLAFFHAGAIYVFVFSILSLIPIAKYIGHATENLALQTSPTLGALMNATFGNAIELIIAIFALQAGLLEVVKADQALLPRFLLRPGLAAGKQNKEKPQNDKAAPDEPRFFSVPLNHDALAKTRLPSEGRGPALLQLSEDTGFRPPPE